MDDDLLLDTNWKFEEIKLVQARGFEDSARQFKEVKLEMKQSYFHLEQGMEELKHLAQQLFNILIPKPTGVIEPSNQFVYKDFEVIPTNSEKILNIRNSAIYEVLDESRETQDTSMWFNEAKDNDSLTFDDLSTKERNLKEGSSQNVALNFEKESSCLAEHELLDKMPESQYHHEHELLADLLKDDDDDLNQLGVAVQVNLMDEPTETKESSCMVAHQMRDKMPKSVLRYEMKTSIISVEHETEAILVNSIEESTEVLMTKCVGVTCYDPGGGSLTPISYLMDLKQVLVARPSRLDEKPDCLKLSKMTVVSTNGNMFTGVPNVDKNLNKVIEDEVSAQVKIEEDKQTVFLNLIRLKSAQFTNSVDGNQAVFLELLASSLGLAEFALHPLGELVKMIAVDGNQPRTEVILGMNFDPGGIDLKRASGIIAMLKYDENGSLLGYIRYPYFGPQQIAFDHGITFGQNYLKANEVSKFVGCKGFLVSFIIKEIFSDVGNHALAFKLIFADKAKFYLGIGGACAEITTPLELYEFRTVTPLAAISVLKLKVLTDTNESREIEMFYHENVVATVILKMENGKVCLDTKAQEKSGEGAQFIDEFEFRRLPIKLNEKSDSPRVFVEENYVTELTFTSLVIHSN